MTKVPVTVLSLLLAANKAASLADKAAGNMAQYCREAASLAAKERPIGTTTQGAYEALIATHGAALKQCDKNVRSTFASFLMIALCPEETVELARPKAATKTTDAAPAVFGPAADATAKHVATYAAQQLREKHGMVKTRGVPAAVVARADDFAEWAAKMPLYLSDKDHAAVIKANLAAAGYTLTRNKVTKTAGETAMSSLATGPKITSTETHAQH